MNPFDWRRRWREREHEAEVKSRFRVMWYAVIASHPDVKLSDDDLAFWKWINS